MPLAKHTSHLSKSGTILYSYDTSNHKLSSIIHYFYTELVTIY